MTSETKDEAATRGASTWVVETVVAALMVCLGAVVMHNSYQLGNGWGEDGPRSGYFPFYIGLLIVASSLVNLYLALGKRREHSVFVAHRELRLVMAVLLPSVVYVVLIRYLGIYVASTIFIGAFMRWQGKFGVAKVVIVSLAVSICLFLMFEIWFKVALPKGPLEALLGY